MSSLIIPAPTPTAEERLIESSAFWPPIDPSKIRMVQRIDNTVTPDRLRSALIESIACCNAALLSWRSTQQSAGFAQLAAVPAETIDGISERVHRYHRAVGCLAKALLLERYRDFDSNGTTERQGDAKNETLTTTIDDCRRDHLNALADIRGLPRSTVELI